MIMRKAIFLLGLGILLSACGPRDRCVAPSAPKPMTAKDLTLIDKANILGVPPSQVPGDPKAASSYGALMTGVNDNAAAQSAYDTFLEHRNATLQQGYCAENEAYKARGMKDEMNTLGRAIMATCHSDDEQAVLAAVLKYRNCAAGS